MNSIHVLIIATFCLIFFTSSKNKSQEKYSPPGTVKIGNQFFMDETEITNTSWKEYVFWIGRIYGNDSKMYASVLPDTTVWEEPFQSQYYNHSSYRNYPVVGISWQQAKDYCTWRSERVMEQNAIFKAKYPNRVYPSKITYRLPSRKEWEEIAMAEYSDKTLKSLNHKYKNSARANYKSTTNSLDTISCTAPVYQYWPNKYGVYQLLGNVSEMIDEQGVAKGGSWNDLEVNVNTQATYTHPSKNIGFRCVCEVTFTESDS